MINGATVDEADDGSEETTVEGELLDWRSVAECARLTALGTRFITTLGQRGDVRRTRAKHGGWNYALEDCQAYVANSGAAAAKLAGAEAVPVPAGKRAGEYESELKTLVNGYKELLTIAQAAVKQSQQHERDLFTAFTGPLKVLTDALQAQATQLSERANAGDKARLDFLEATEIMLREQREADTNAKRQEHLRALRLSMWDDVKKAAPHVWSQIQESLGATPEQLNAMRAAGKLRETLEKEKVAALFAFDFLTNEQKDLLCAALNYDRGELEAMAKEGGADATEETTIVEGDARARE